MSGLALSFGVGVSGRSSCWKGSKARVKPFAESQDSAAALVRCRILNTCWFGMVPVSSTDTGKSRTRLASWPQGCSILPVGETFPPQTGRELLQAADAMVRDSDREA